MTHFIKRSNGVQVIFKKARNSTTSVLLLVQLVKELQYNTVKPNLKGSAVLHWFRNSFGFKKAKIKKRKILDLIYLSVYQLDSV